jgi:hypothetical protein
MSDNRTPTILKLISCLIVELHWILNISNVRQSIRSIHPWILSVQSNVVIVEESFGSVSRWLKSSCPPSRQMTRVFLRGVRAQSLTIVSHPPTHCWATNQGRLCAKHGMSHRRQLERFFERGKSALAHGCHEAQKTFTVFAYIQRLTIVSSHWVDELLVCRTLFFGACNTWSWITDYKKKIPGRGRKRQ